MNPAPTQRVRRRWLRGALLSSLGLVLAAVLFGAVFEAVARKRAATNHPPPGEMVGVGGSRLHLDCRGSGSPTVVFESGLDINGSLSWSAVHDSIAASTRACAYDRAGIMWSDPHSGPRSASTVARELRAALTAAEEREPVILVGHSLGGLYAVAFTNAFGADVAGLVLVDPTHPDLPARFAEQFGTSLAPPTAALRIGQALSTVGLLRVAIVNGAFPQIPASLWTDVAAYAGQSLPAILDETAHFSESLREAGTVRSLGDRPLVVLTAMAPLSDGDLAALKLTAEDGGRFKALLQELHRDQASWSTRGRQVLVPEAGHYIQFDRPRAVVTAVREVIAEVRLSRTHRQEN